MRDVPWAVLLALMLPAVLVAAEHPTARQIVVQTTATTTAASPQARRAALATQIAPLGLHVRRAFRDDLPVRGRMSSAPRAPRNPFDFDPARVWLLEARDSVAAAHALRALAVDPAFEWAEPNARRDPAAFPDDPLFVDGRQWGLLNRNAAATGAPRADMHAVEAWRMSRGSNVLRLAVADTGIDPAHPDLAARLPDGSTRIEHGINITTEASRSWADSLGHGTPVAGVMAARSGEGAHFDSLGVAGVCGGDGGQNVGCRLIPIKITPGRTSTATSFDIARAIVYATDMGARAMNLSFVGLRPSRLERLALYHAITRGCVVVTASGNRGFTDGTRPHYPAAYAADGLCIQVGASDPFDRRAAFSSYGPGLDLVAPGTDIWSTSITYPSPSGFTTGGYVAASGTSFATPFVTGTVGLLCAMRPELRDTDLQEILRTSATDIEALGIDRETGWGRLDAAAALNAVRRTYGIWHDEAAADRVTRLGTDTLTIGEAGPGAMARPGPRAARLVEVTATVVLPDSFRGEYRVWPRIGGTMTVRAGFDLPYFVPWAEVVDRGAGAFTLRGYMYETDDGVVPLPLDQARFGFTVIGPVARSVAVPAAPTANTLQAVPNPFRRSLALSGPAGAALDIHDLSGRLVRRLPLDANVGTAVWDGRDRHGQDVPAGLYFIRCRAVQRWLQGKVLKLE